MTAVMTATEAPARHVLDGIRPEPLASYLAGLGLIRLIGRADPAATFAWEAGGLVVQTSIPDLAGWLVDEYVPTPVLSPWNGGSGFWPKDVEPKRRLARLLEDPSPRLAHFRQAVDAACAVIGRGQAAGWIAADGKRDKERLVQEFRNRCPESLLPWIDACVVLAEDRAFFPPLLGTGGNDGRLDFSTNFHEQLLVVLDSAPAGLKRSRASARDLLAGSEIERLAGAPVGQFDPAGAGGQASSPYGAAASLVNPWKYVLLVEGALLFASGTTRRHQHAAGRASMPFTVSFSPDGSVSGAAGEESRGEVWAPAWSSPFTLAEVSQLFGEARAAWRGRPAQRAVDFYAATRALGVARGVTEFARYGLQQRNGLAFVAVPLDRVQVVDKPHVRLAARIEDWVSWLPGADASRTVGTSLRQFETAHLRYAKEGDAVTLRNLLAALTALEQAVGRSGRMREKVRVWRARSAADFLSVLADGQECRELRLAVGIASCTAGRGSTARSMRQLLLPVDPGDRNDPKHRDGRWRDAPLVPGFGVRPLRSVLADVLIWRSRTAPDDVSAESDVAFRGVPAFRQGVRVPASDLHALAADPAIGGDSLLDDELLSVWLSACLALDWRGVSHRWAGPFEAVVLNPALVLLHALAAGLPAGDGASTTRLGLGPDWATRLASGRVDSVHVDAVRRLRQAGWQAVAPPVRTAPPAAGQRALGVGIAAALVPRCDRPLVTLKHCALKTPANSADSDNAASASSTEHTTSPEMTEELS